MKAKVRVRAMLLFAPLLAIILFACRSAKIDIRLKPPKRIVEASGTLQAGAARVDITPPPGYPMSGYSIFGRFSRGWWTRLFARAIYLEDARGQRIALVSCDLQGVPAGLTDRVAEIVGKQIKSPHPDSVHLGREQIIVAATHTHNSQGNIFSSAAYNSQASTQGGFDRSLFEFTANRIAHAIQMAVEGKEAATVKVAARSLPGLTRNRSLDAFLKNPKSERNSILGHVSEAIADSLFRATALPPSVPSNTALRAIDPTLTILSIEPQGSERAPIAVAAFYAMHQTAMGATTEVYSSDVFGVASTLVEQHLRREWSDGNTVVALFNGPEGDVSPNWIEQDRHNTMRIGQDLASGIIATLKTAAQAVAGPISYRYKVVKLSKSRVTDLHGDGDSLGVSDQLQTANGPYPGVATLGGADDGRTIFYYFGLREGIKADDFDPIQGYKLFSVDKAIELFVPQDKRALIGNLVSEIVKKKLAKDLPDKIPLGVYSIGPVVMAILPGEFTVGLGNRIKRTLETATGAEHVLLIGLANEYLSYFTTPFEYNEQHYEGASTMYGLFSGLFIEDQLARIAKVAKNTAAYEHKRTYKAGEEAPPDFGRIKLNDNWQLEEALQNLLQDHKGNLERYFPQFAWSDPVSALGATGSLDVVNPVVAIEEKSGNGWLHYESDPASLNFVVVVESVTPDSAFWRSAWMVPADFDTTKTVRFKVTTPRGREIHSESFQPKGILIGDQTAVILVSNKS